MKLNQNPNLRVEDFQSENAWIGRLFIQLNPFIQAVNQIINSNINFIDNIKSVTKDYSISTFQEFSFMWPYSDESPNELRVIRASKGSRQIPTILLAAWSYDQSEKTITVSRMAEINSASVGELSGSYQFSIRVTV